MGDLTCNTCRAPVTGHLRAGPVLCRICRARRIPPSEHDCIDLYRISPILWESVWCRWTPQCYRAVLKLDPTEYGAPLEGRTDPEDTYANLKQVGVLKPWKPTGKVPARVVEPIEVEILDNDQLRAADTRWRRRHPLIHTNISVEVYALVERTDAEARRRPGRSRYPLWRRWSAAMRTEYQRALALRTRMVNGQPVSTYDVEEGHAHGAGLAPYEVRVADPLAPLPPQKTQFDGAPPLPPVHENPEHDLAADLATDRVRDIFYRGSREPETPLARRYDGGDDRNGWAAPSRSRRPDFRDAPAFARMLVYTGVEWAEIGACDQIIAWLERYCSREARALATSPAPRMVTIAAKGSRLWRIIRRRSRMKLPVGEPALLAADRASERTLKRQDRLLLATDWLDWYRVRRGHLILKHRNGEQFQPIPENYFVS